MINLRQMEAFHAVMESGSVTKAAELLHITQPAVTKLIKSLEVSVNLTLFTRTNKRLAPTMEAHRLHSEIDNLLIHINKIGQLANEIRSIGFGHLKVASLPAMGLNFVPDVLADFRTRYPGVKVDLSIATSQKVLEWVLMRQADIGIVAKAINLEAVNAQDMPPLKGVVILPPGHALASRKSLTPGDLDQQPFISLGTEDRSRHTVDSLFNELNIPRVLEIETHMAASACQFVANGSGVSIVDPISAHYNRDRVASRPIEPTVRFQFCIIRPIGHLDSSYASEFVDLLLKRLEEFT